MAKLKSKINSKYKAKPKRKLVLGGLEDSPYLGKTLYESQTAPNAMFEAQSNVLQTQFEKDKAARDEQLKRNLLDRQMLEMQMANSATEQRQQEEKAARQMQEQATINNAQKQLTTAAGLAGKDIATTLATVGTATKLPSNTAGAVLSKADAKMLGVKSASRFAGQGVSKFSYGSNLANLGVGVGLGLTGEAIGYFGNKRDDKLMEQQGRSQYYDDTNFSRAEFNSQLGKSTFKGAGMGSSFGPVGTAIGAGVGLAYGLGKALHERRMTKSEDERGFKIGNKRFGKKLLFGEENVYDENLDPTVVEKRRAADSLASLSNTANAMESARMASMMQSDLNTGNRIGMAKYGGAVEYLKGGIAIPIGKNAVKLLGNSHEKGGMVDPKEPNIEYEGDETIHGDKYVFSATLKLPNGETYAQAHERLIKSGASGKEIEQLALSQEAAAGRNPNQIKGMKFAKYGGPLQYDKGGLTETDPPTKESESTKLKGEEGYWQIYDIAKKLGEPFPEVVAAQWAIESSWGASDTGANNPFGQTAAKGESSTNLSTSKDPSGGSKNFVNYGSLEEAVQARINKWSSKYKDAKTPEEALYILQNNGGEPRYAEGFPTSKFPKGDWEQYIKTAMSIINKRPVSVEDPNFVKNENESNYRNDIPTLQKMLIDSGMSDEEFGREIYPKELIAKLRNGTATAKEFEDAEAAYETRLLAEETPTSANEVLNAVFKPKLHKGKENPYIPIGITAAKNPKKVVTETPVIAPPVTTTTQTPVVTQTPIGVTPPVNTTVEETPKTTTGKFRDINMNPIPLEQEEIPTFITDAKTGERIELSPKRDNFNPDIVPDSKYSSGSNIGGGSTSEDQTMKKDTKKDTQPVSEDNYRKLAYAAQFAQPAYALLNPYKSKYSEAPVSISAPMAGMIPTVGTNINLSREDFNPIIAGINAQVAAGTENTRNISGPGGVAAEIALRGKGMQAMLDTKAKEADANRKLSDAEKQLQLTASMKNQAAAQNAIQMQTQVAAQQAQLEAGRGARVATAKEAANLEKYTNTGQAIGYAGAGIGTMYKDQNQLDTQYKIALATDPTGSAARWLQSNDPAAYERYVKSMQTEPVETTEKKFGGLKNSYVSRLGQLSKRPLKAKI
jgi:hypothetical protein